MLDKDIIAQFGFSQIKNVTSLSTGLINNSFAIECNDGNDILLQQINTSIFLHPENIQSNYELIFNHFNNIGSYQLPRIIKTIDGQNLLRHNGATWRCFEYMQNTYSPLTAHTPEEAYIVAKCFGKFSADLSTIEKNKLHYVLPGFHNLSLRFEQFESALSNTTKQRKVNVEDLIDLAYANHKYVKWFKSITQKPDQYPLHILHQDCKIANILFFHDNPTKLCPIDLDTTQPGLFFSDIGDMVRSMVPNISENDTDIDSMELRIDFYEAIKSGYMESMSDYLTKEELNDIDLSGNIIIYMQALRFLTDFLNGDIYYKTSYSGQNKDRAKNQFKLLQLLQTYQQKVKAKITID
ncbi:MAG: hypothetical protein DI598_07765 [Pseudopedobacter saltans]|uniref:Aminoglycoside phosphotransferase domain-containing protein n=1 Tax=Pseudopedobacter saltans TaxID=151895 RepID=A0A2W5F261_9SPHI|nr:MAG: hypothetical protein DI598_07765 [Pseudopedobacter saltans]